MAHKHRFDYFDAFVQISNYAVEYADELADYLMGHYDEEKRLGFISPDEVLERYKVLHDIEERSDSVVQEITENLIVEFIAPIEREDILELADELEQRIADGVSVFPEGTKRILITGTPMAIPYMKLETDYSQSDAGQFETRIAAFIEML